ncbi:MAG: hypothetical protein IPO37_03170 [Saprospiraceae bacterium]|nr:hypothetical protein [Saprospiraceae bacterium]
MTRLNREQLTVTEDVRCSGKKIKTTSDFETSAPAIFISKGSGKRIVCITIDQMLNDKIVDAMGLKTKMGNMSSYKPKYRTG